MNPSSMDSPPSTAMSLDTQLILDAFAALGKRFDAFGERLDRRFAASPSVSAPAASVVPATAPAPAVNTSVAPAPSTPPTSTTAASSPSASAASTTSSAPIDPVARGAKEAVEFNSPSRCSIVCHSADVRELVHVSTAAATMVTFSDTVSTELASPNISTRGEFIDGGLDASRPCRAPLCQHRPRRPCRAALRWPHSRRPWRGRLRVPRLRRPRRAPPLPPRPRCPRGACPGPDGVLRVPWHSNSPCAEDAVPTKRLIRCSTIFLSVLSVPIAPSVLVQAGLKHRYITNTIPAYLMGVVQPLVPRLVSAHNVLVPMVFHDLVSKCLRQSQNVDKGLEQYLLNFELVDISPKLPWPPPMQPQMQYVGVPLRPTPWPSFDFHPVTHLVEFWSMLFNGSVVGIKWSEINNIFTYSPWEYSVDMYWLDLLSMVYVGPVTEVLKWFSQINFKFIAHWPPFTASDVFDLGKSKVDLRFKVLSDSVQLRPSPWPYFSWQTFKHVSDILSATCKWDCQWLMASFIQWSFRNCQWKIPWFPPLLMRWSADAIVEVIVITRDLSGTSRRISKKLFSLNDAFLSTQEAFTRTGNSTIAWHVVIQKWKCPNVIITSEVWFAPILQFTIPVYSLANTSWYYDDLHKLVATIILFCHTWWLGVGKIIWHTTLVETVSEGRQLHLTRLVFPEVQQKCGTIFRASYSLVGVKWMTNSLISAIAVVLFTCGNAELIQSVPRPYFCWHDAQVQVLNKQSSRSLVNIFLWLFTVPMLSEYVFAMELLQGHMLESSCISLLGNVYVLQNKYCLRLCFLEPFSSSSVISCQSVQVIVANWGQMHCSYFLSQVVWSIDSYCFASDFKTISLQHYDTLPTPPDELVVQVCSMLSPDQCPEALSPEVSALIQEFHPVFAHPVFALVDDLLFPRSSDHTIALLPVVSVFISASFWYATVTTVHLILWDLGGGTCSFDEDTSIGLGFKMKITQELINIMNYRRLSLCMFNFTIKWWMIHEILVASWKLLESSVSTW